MSNQTSGQWYYNKTAASMTVSETAGVYGEYRETISKSIETDQGVLTIVRYDFCSDGDNGYIVHVLLCDNLGGELIEKPDWLDVSRLQKVVSDPRRVAGVIPPKPEPDSYCLISSNEDFDVSLFRYDGGVELYALRNVQAGEIEYTTDYPDIQDPIFVRQPEEGLFASWRSG